jgi:hypothetical protein
MPDLPKYHLGEQRADAILRPMALTLRDLEARAAHYHDRLVLTPKDQEAVVAALAALTTARAELEKLWQARTATPRH